MITGTRAEYQSDAGSTKDTPYLAAMGCLLCIFFLENWPRYNGTALYISNEMWHNQCLLLVHVLLTLVDITAKPIISLVENLRLAPTGSGTPASLSSPSILANSCAKHPSIWAWVSSVFIACVFTWKQKYVLILGKSDSLTLLEEEHWIGKHCIIHIRKYLL